MKILITCGPTWVSIDDVRVISNISTGEMGRLIAKTFRQKKAKVTIIQGPMFFDDFAAALKKEVTKKYDVVVHAAAVSDYKVQGASKQKLASNRPRTLRLTPTPKLIKTIKRLSPKSFLVGFKLESAVNEKTAVQMSEYLVKEAGCDLVVANTLKGGYKGFVLNAEGNILSKAVNKETMAKNLVKLIMSPPRKRGSSAL